MPRMGQNLGHPRVHKMGIAQKSYKKQKKTTAFRLESGGFMERKTN